MATPPPNLKRREADEGDRVVFIVDRHGNSQYFAHVDHQGTVEDVVLTYEKNRSAPRATYTVACACGLVLHPRSTAFDLA